MKIKLFGLVVLEKILYNKFVFWCMCIVEYMKSVIEFIKKMVKLM